MELPTYTNIWKIEKRLYKLYDFRLPMPLPVGQVAAFLAIAVPYTLILTMAGMPFSHTWLWLYILPPGVLAWLVTRPVIEGKRLPELIASHLRYLSEPRTWCRMAPLTEKDEVSVVARVWRLPAPAPALETAPAVVAGAAPTATPAPTATAAPGRTRASAATTAPTGTPVPTGTAVPTRTAAQTAETAPLRPVWPGRPLRAAEGSQARQRGTEQVSGMPDRAAHTSAAPDSGARARPARTSAATDGQMVRATAAQASGARAQAARVPVRPAQPRESAEPGKRPALTVRAEGGAERPLHVVERALRSSPAGRTDPWRESVVVVPGGHRPGKPDQVQRDQARARLPLPGAARIVMLGCIVGAGQTTTTLLTGQLLASLRGEAVAVLDLNPGPGSLTERAREIPRLMPVQRAARRATSSAGGPGRASGRERGLQVVTADYQPAEPEDADRLIDAVVARYPLTLADPKAAHVPKSLHVADQLVLVAPARPAAASALAMTFEWLDANGHANLASAAVTVLNGVSAGNVDHADKVAAIATGRCRAIVRVAWDGGLAGSGPLGVTAVQAYTALVGVLVSGLADPALSGSSQR